MIRETIFTLFALVGFIVCSTLALSVILTVIGIMGPSLFIFLAIALVAVALALGVKGRHQPQKRQTRSCK